MRLLEEELARAHLSKEFLKEQGHKTLSELAKTRIKAENDEDQLKETIRGFREAAERWKRRCQDIVDSAEEQVNAATTEASFWKDRFFKLAGLANQALRDIPRGLQAAEGMAGFIKLPREITGFLSLCREFYDQLRARANHDTHTQPPISYSSPHPSHGASNRRARAAKHPDQGRGRPNEGKHGRNKRTAE
ncbi:hypothetical protein CR513_12549, partial [Mucuna pruriens]